MLSSLFLSSFTAEQAATRQLESLAGFWDSVPTPRLLTTEQTWMVLAHSNVALSGCPRTDASTSESGATPRSEKEPQFWDSGGPNASPSFVWLWTFSESSLCDYVCVLHSLGPEVLPTPTCMHLKLSLSGPSP